MLGVRRPTVTLAAGMLQKAGLIHYSRGVVTILDRAGLEQVSCECHSVSRNEYLRLLGRLPTGEATDAYNGRHGGTAGARELRQVSNTSVECG